MFTHHLSTIAPVKSSFWRHFHAGDHSRDGKSFPCATAGQGKTTASNGLGLVFLFYFSIPFDAPTKQHDPREYKWKFDNSLCFSFFLPLFFFCVFVSFSETSLSGSLTFTSSSLIAAPLNCLSVKKGAIVQPHSPYSSSPCFDLWLVIGGGSSLTLNQWL